MKLEMSLKKNVVGDLKFWKYFRTRFAGTHPPRLLVSPGTPEPRAMGTAGPKGPHKGT